MSNLSIRIKYFEVFIFHGLKTQNVQTGLSNIGYFGVQQNQKQLPFHSQVNDSELFVMKWKLMQNMISRALFRSYDLAV